MSASIATIVFPLFSGFFAICSAAYVAAPEDIPANIPSSFASLSCVSAASSSFTGYVPSIRFSSKTPGMNPGPIPCILCGPFSPFPIVWLPSGSTAIAWNPGFSSFRIFEIPVIVPVVPTADTSMSTPLLVSLISSCAVVSLCILGLNSFSNCCGITAFGISFASSSAFLTAPAIPSDPGVSTISAPYTARSFLLSWDIVSGIVRMSLYPFAAATNASPIPVFPLVGSIRTVSGFISPVSSPYLMSATPTLSFTLLCGLKDSSFTSTSASIPYVSLFSLTRGVFPMVSVMSFATPLVNSGMFRTMFFSSPFFYYIILFIFFIFL